MARLTQLQSALLFACLSLLRPAKNLTCVAKTLTDRRALGWWPAKTTFWEAYFVHCHVTFLLPLLASRLLFTQCQEWKTKSSLKKNWSYTHCLKKRFALPVASVNNIGTRFWSNLTEKGLHYDASSMRIELMMILILGSWSNERNKIIGIIRFYLIFPLVSWKRAKNI